MMLSRYPVVALRSVGPGTYVLAIQAPEIASKVLPAQFLNIKVNDLHAPLLRRPFSVYRVDGEIVEIIFHVVGSGTAILSEATPGTTLDVLGPLGHAYGLDGDYETALLVAGGLGVAPLPITTAALARRSKRIHTFLGARSAAHLLREHLVNVEVATDDGSAGHHGTVVDLLKKSLATSMPSRPKIFACGPNPMLNALARAAAELGIVCEVSLESVMGCGIGICQGCPVELRSDGKKYALICKEGTVFDSRDVVLS
jgi:dihydroorotate dehydrogenase electron transfer subunit